MILLGNYGILSLSWDIWEGGMGLKEYDGNMCFVDLDLSKTLGFSRAQRFLMEIHDHINWKPIESILLEAYPVGKSLCTMR